MIEARFRHRAKEQETISCRHAQVIARLRAIEWLWRDDVSKVKVVSEGESGACDLGDVLRKGITGAVSYSARFVNGMQDRAMFDDVLTFQIDEHSVSYKEFVNVFSDVVIAFGAYRAAVVHDLDLDLDDYDEIVARSQESGKDVDGRESVFRINPLNFFDNVLCVRAFGMEANQVAERLDGHVESVVVDGGVLVMVTSDLVDRENLKGLHDYICSLLDIGNEVSS